MNVKMSVHFRGGGPVWEPVQAGPDVVSARLQYDVLMAPALKQALSRSAIIVQNDAKRMTPVDAGRLRASVTHSLDSRPVPLYAIVGTNVAYAPFVHNGRAPGKMPPPAALRTWARRHGGINPFALARAIARHGIRARPFLTDALFQNIDNIRRELAIAARMIEAAWKTS